MEHPLSQFRYCPKCGSEHFDIHNEKSKQCKDCGFVYYFNPSSASVALILNKQNELLVCRRAKEPAKGTLDLPGGFIDMAETGEEGVAREVKEETGMTVTQAEYLFSLPNIYIYSGFPVHTLDMFFRCTVAAFQANRLKCRYRSAEKKTELCHTLNGSALALPRIVAALLENNQTPEGIRIPKALVPYCGFEMID